MESIIYIVVLPLLIWGFIAYIKALIDAAKNDKLGWLILMIFMWPMFIFYTKKEDKYSPSSKYTNGKFLK